MIVTLEPDGTTTPNPSGAPTSFLADGTGFRVVMRFIQASEGLISYNGLATTKASYNAVKAGYATYNAIVVDSALASNVDVDIACVCSGTTLRNGRSGLFTEIEAATCDLSIVDRTGLFDPRNTNTVFGPGRRVRAGTWVQVSVWLGATLGWRAMFTGLVDTWQREISAEDQSTSDVRVACTDFFGAIGAATFNGAVIAQLTGARATALLAGVWSTLWGVTSIATGTVQLDARTLDDAGVLEQLKAGAAVEDGRVYVAPDGTLRIETGTWRNTRTTELTVLGIGAADFRESLAVCTYNTIAATVVSYTTLKSAFLVYNDMRVCHGTGVAPIPTVCATRMTSADSSDDVVNEVVLEYQAPQTASGYVQGEGTPVVANGPTEYVARDPASVTRYGLRSIKRSDLTPSAAATVLPPLASKLVDRWRDGDATITSVGINLTREVGAAQYVTGLFSGDVINVVDRMVPSVATDDEWIITSTEVAGLAWNITPTTFDVELILDELSAA